jgi:hypothetical protein
VRKGDALGGPSLAGSFGKRCLGVCQLLVHICSNRRRSVIERCGLGERRKEGADRDVFDVPGGDVASHGDIITVPAADECDRRCECVDPDDEVESGVTICEGVLAFEKEPPQVQGALLDARWDAPAVDQMSSFDNIPVLIIAVQ